MSDTWDIPTRNERALAYIERRRYEIAERKHIKFVRVKNRITGVVTSGLGAIALMGLISISALTFVTFLTVIIRG